MANRSFLICQRCLFDEGSRFLSTAKTLPRSGHACISANIAITFVLISQDSNA